MNDQLLEGYPVVIEIPVAWGDMDSFQHVNNINYFRYFESSRSLYSKKVELQNLKGDTGIEPLLGSTSSTYNFPLTYPDTNSVEE